MPELLVERPLLNSLRQHVDATKHKGEAGGLLLGLRKEGAIQIVSATFPKRWDRPSPVSFFRSNRGHRIAALRTWRQSGETVDWVGEWHSHPKGSAQPSGTDLRTWSRVVTHTRQSMVFIIIGGTETYVGFQKDRGCVMPMKVSQSEDDWLLYNTAPCARGPEQKKI